MQQDSEITSTNSLYVWSSGLKKPMRLFLLQTSKLYSRLAMPGGLPRLLPLRLKESNA